MIVSDKILPIRFYNDLYDQTRFKHNCNDNCQFKLIYPASELPMFQFKRDVMFAAPSKFFLRNICNDIDNDYYKEVPEGADNLCNKALFSSFTSKTFPMLETVEFGAPPAQSEIEAFDIDCCKLKLLSQNIPSDLITFVSSPNIFIPISSSSDRYHFKLIVDKLIGSCTISIYNGANLIDIVTSAGVYDYYFDSTFNSIQLIFNKIAYGDQLEISYIQATRLLFDTILTNDVELDETQLKVINLKEGKDVIMYCQTSSSSFNIPDGEYYYVVKSGTDYYFSEIFKIISWKEIQKYYKLNWYNTCDFNNSVIYSETISSCSFYNNLYLDAGLIKPEYDTVEDSEVNGDGDLNVRFKKWQKNISFEVGKSPEFLTDALSAVFLHSNKSILQPLNNLQEIQNNNINILKITSDISDILYECFQKINLKLLLEDKITDSACCNLAEVYDCTPCDYTAGTSPEDCSSGYFVTIADGNGIWWSPGCTDVPRYSMTLYKCNGTPVNVKETDLICYNGKYYRLSYYSGLNCAGSANVQFWYASLDGAPVITSVAFAFIGFYVTGYGLPNAWVKIYHNIDSAGWVAIDIVATDSNGYFIYLAPAALYTPYLPIGKIEYKIEALTPNCSYGESDVECIGTC